MEKRRRGAVASAVAVERPAVNGLRYLSGCGQKSRGERGRGDDGCQKRRRRESRASILYFFLFWAASRMLREIQSQMAHTRVSVHSPRKSRTRRQPPSSSLAHHERRLQSVHFRPHRRHDCHCKPSVADKNAAHQQLTRLSRGPPTRCGPNGRSVRFTSFHLLFPQYCLQDMQCVENCDDPNPRHRIVYEQPVWQTLQMFRKVQLYHRITAYLTLFVFDSYIRLSWGNALCVLLYSTSAR